MTTTPSTAVKGRQTAHWNAVADGWDAWLDWTERNFHPLTTWFHEAAGWTPRARVLDVACGAGYPALAAARAVRPGGRVLATDLAPLMVSVASNRARTEGLDNIEFLQMDAEALQVDNESFDAVTNAYGLMFCPDPATALTEARRVLVADGRIAIAVWDEPSMSPFFTAIRGAAASFFTLPDPAPHEPGPFRLASAEALHSLLEAAGFAAVRVERFPMTFECESVVEYCQMFTDLAWRSRVTALSSDDAGRFRTAVAEAVRPFVVGGRLRLVATSLRASAVR